MIQIVLRELDKDIILSLKESKEYIKGMWLFNHGSCCGLVDYNQMENYAIEMLPEYNKDSLIASLMFPSSS